MAKPQHMLLHGNQVLTACYTMFLDFEIVFKIVLNSSDEVSANIVKYESF